MKMLLQWERSSETIGSRFLQVFTTVFISWRLVLRPRLAGWSPVLIWAASWSSMICWAAWERNTNILQTPHPLMYVTLYLTTVSTWTDVNAPLVRYEFHFHIYNLKTLQMLLIEYSGHALHLPWILFKRYSKSNQRLEDRWQLTR